MILIALLLIGIGFFVYDFFSLIKAVKQIKRGERSYRTSDSMAILQVLFGLSMLVLFFIYKEAIVSKIIETW